MTIEISSDNPRSIRAIEIAADSGQWLKCKTAEGKKAYGVPSQRQPGVYHLATCGSCTCQDAQRHPAKPCKHQLAVRLVVELAKARQPKPKGRPVLDLVRHADGELSWHGEGVSHSA